MSTKLASLFTAAAVTLVATSAVNAAFYALGTSTTVAPTSNAAITAAPGETVTLQLWGRATGPAVGAYINSFTFRLEGTGLALTAADVPVAFNPALTHGGPRNLPAASTGVPAGNGLTFQAINSFGIGGTGSQSGINNSLVWLATLSVVVPASATNGQSSNLFLTQGQIGAVSSLTESSSSGTRHAVGFTTSNPSTLGTPSVTGADGNVISGAGVTTNNSNGFQYNLTAPTRTTTADATITVEVIPTGPTVSLTAGGASPALVLGDQFSYAPTLTNAGAFSFAGNNLGATLVAYDLPGNVGVPDGLSGGTVVTDPAVLAYFNSTLGAGFDFVINFGNQGNGPFTAAITGVQPTRIAAIPEPTALGLLAPVALLAARRRRA